MLFVSARILAELAPDEPEVHGLVALMEIQASRASARFGPAGKPILLFDRDRAPLDQLLIRRGLAALERAGKLGGTARPSLIYGPTHGDKAAEVGHHRLRPPAVSGRLPS